MSEAGASWQSSTLYAVLHALLYTMSNEAVSTTKFSFATKMSDLSTKQHARWLIGLHCEMLLRRCDKSRFFYSQNFQAVLIQRIFKPVTCSPMNISSLLSNINVNISADVTRVVLERMLVPIQSNNTLLEATPLGEDGNKELSSSRMHWHIVWIADCLLSLMPVWRRCSLTDPSTCPSTRDQRPCNRTFSEEAI